MPLHINCVDALRAALSGITPALLTEFVLKRDDHLVALSRQSPDAQSRIDLYNPGRAGWPEPHRKRRLVLTLLDLIGAAVLAGAFLSGVARTFRLVGG